MQNITVLGATGSIGISTLDVIARHPDRYRVFALTGNSRVKELAEQCRIHSPKYAVVVTQESAEQLKKYIIELGLTTKVVCGEQALVDVASDAEVDTVMAAIVGAAGLVPTLAAAHSGKKILLANKEALVMAGGLFMEAVRSGGAELLPIDSEHNAIFQCLPTDYRSHKEAGISKILLTASGGPFLTSHIESLAAVTPEQACAHPNWVMGRKISVDSASMMNKGLELIEACWLFDITPQEIEVVIHPQSVIHSMVQYVDGSVLAQLGNPDMRTPIAHAMAWPERIDSGVAPLDMVAVAQLQFASPDYQRFPCLKLAEQAAAQGGDVPAALNAANEIAVEAFLQRRISFVGISQVVDAVLQRWQSNEPTELQAVQAADEQARKLAEAAVLVNFR
jgi:1-deoxy-D-xylulose-5-phosphate reductoisomerase